MSLELFINLTTAVATFLMAMGTFIVVIQNDRDKKEANRAHITVYIKSINNILYFVVQNTGLTNAYNIKLTPKKPVENIRGDILDSWFDNLIPSLPRNHESLFVFETNAKEYFDKHEFKSPTYKIEVEFKDVYKKTQKYEEIINLNYVRNRGMYVGKSSEHINEELHEINKTLKKFSKNKA